MLTFLRFCRDVFMYLSVNELHSVGCFFLTILMFLSAFTSLPSFVSGVSLIYFLWSWNSKQIFEVRNPCCVKSLEFPKSHIMSLFALSLRRTSVREPLKEIPPKSSNVKLFLLKIHLQSNVYESTLCAYQCRTNEDWARESFCNTWFP